MPGLDGVLARFDTTEEFRTAQCFNSMPWAEQRSHLGSTPCAMWWANIVLARSHRADVLGHTCLTTIHCLQAKLAQASWQCRQRAGRAVNSVLFSNIATAAECKIHSTALGKLCCWSTAENIWSASAGTFAELTPGSYCVCNSDPIKGLWALASNS